MVLEYLFAAPRIAVCQSVRFLFLVVLASPSLPAQGAETYTISKLVRNSSAASLDPRQWPSEELARYIRMQLGQPVGIVDGDGPGGQWTTLEINPQNGEVNGATTRGLPSLFEGF